MADLRLSYVEAYDRAWDEIAAIREDEARQAARVRRLRTERGAK